LGNPTPAFRAACANNYEFYYNPAVLIGDKVNDADPLDASLRGSGIKMVAPHRKIFNQNN